MSSMAEKIIFVASATPAVAMIVPPHVVEAAPIDDLTDDDTPPTLTGSVDQSSSSVEEPAVVEPERIAISPRLFERRDGVVQKDPRIVSNPVIQAMSNGIGSETVSDSSSNFIVNPISTGAFEGRRPDFSGPNEQLTDRVARQVAGIVSGIVGQEDTDVSQKAEPSIATVTPIENSSTSLMVDPNEASMNTPPANSSSRIIVNGVEFTLPSSSQPISLKLNEDGSILLSGEPRSVVESAVYSESVTSNENISLVPSTVAPRSNILEKNAQGFVELDSLVEELKATASPTSNGLYYMPDPVIENGKINYLFDKDTCNSERKGSIEQIAAIIAISRKYNELVSTKYPQHAGSVLDIGDMMSDIHIEHDEVNPAVDFRSRMINSPSGSNDGPAFVPMSPNYDPEFTVELIDYMHSLAYQGSPIGKYVITAENGSLSQLAAYLKRHNSNRQFLIIKADHPEHLHFAFVIESFTSTKITQDDYSAPCAASGADFTEASDVVEVGQSTSVTDVPTGRSDMQNSESALSLGSSVVTVGGSEADPVIMDDPNLIKHWQEVTVATNSSTIVEPSLESETPAVNTITSSTALDRNSASVQGAIAAPTSELARVMQANLISDGSRTTTTIIGDLSVFSRNILNSIDSYAPISPYVAAELRQNNPRFSQYFPQLEKVDRKLTDVEVMARARVAHEIVFGARYGVEYSDAKIKDDVERLTAFTARESLRYPAAVGDYRTEGANSGSAGLAQILNWDVTIDSNIYEGPRDFDSNLDPLQNLINAFKLVDDNRQNGRSSFADWESGWKSDEGKRSDMEKYEVELARIRELNIFDQVENLGRTA